MAQNYSRIREGHRKQGFKGPEDRVKELRALRAQVLKRKATDEYDPQMQLKSIDHEIARLTRPLKD